MILYDRIINYNVQALKGNDAMKYFGIKINDKYTLVLIIANAGTGRGMLKTHHYFESWETVFNIDCQGVPNTIFTIAPRFRDTKRVHIAVTGSLAHFVIEFSNNMLLVSAQKQECNGYGKKMSNDSNSDNHHNKNSSFNKICLRMGNVRKGCEYLHLDGMVHYSKNNPCAKASAANMTPQRPATTKPSPILFISLILKVIGYVFAVFELKLREFCDLECVFVVVLNEHDFKNDTNQVFKYFSNETFDNNGNWNASCRASAGMYIFIFFLFRFLFSWYAISVL